MKHAWFSAFVYSYAFKKGLHEKTGNNQANSKH